MRYNKKTQTTAILTIAIAGIIIALFFAGWMYMFNSMTNVLSNVPSSNAVNMSYAISNTIQPVNHAMSGLNAISICIMIGLILGSFIEAYFVRKHPILLVVHILIVSLAITASIYVSNQYESLMQNALLGSYISGNTALSFFVLNLPLIVGVVGFVGLILMFIAINRDSEYNKGGTI
jgi:hypothetical protein